MTNHHLAEAYYPAWLKVLSYLGIPAMTAAALWLISRPLWEQGISPLQYVAGLAMGAAVLYQCSIGWLALKYLNSRIIAFDDRLGSNRKELNKLFLGKIRTRKGIFVCGCYTSIPQERRNINLGYVTFKYWSIITLVESTG